MGEKVVALGVWRGAVLFGVLVASRWLSSS